MRLLTPLLFVLCILSGAAPAQNILTPPAHSDPYTVTGVTVTARGTDGVKAREAALAQALAQAYAILADRFITDPAARAAHITPDVPIIGALLKDFTTTQERANARQYSAVFDVRFKPAAVTRHFAQAPSPSLAAAPTLPDTTPPPAASGPVSDTPAAPPALPTAPISRDHQIVAETRFQSLRDWQQLRARLQTAPGISSVRVLAMKTTWARLQLAHTGSIDELKNRLAGQNIALQSGVPGTPYQLYYKSLLGQP